MVKVTARQWAKWIRRSKPLVFVLCSIPAAILVFDIATGNISADPIEDLTRVTGIWGLRLLLITLAITPLRFITGINQIVMLRRMLGVFAFFYILLHFLTWLVIDKLFRFSAHYRRHHRALLHTLWLPGICHADSPGNNLNESYGALGWRETLDEAAQAHLPDLDFGHRSLLPPSQSRYNRTGHPRCNSGYSAGLSGLEKTTET